MARKPIVPKDDLAELDEVVKVHEEGVDVPLLSIDGFSLLGFGIRIAGPESQKYQVARDQMVKDITHATISAEGQIADSDRRKIETAFLSRISLAFTGPAKLDGKILENTEEDFVKLYRRFDFIRRQIDGAQANRENFTPRSSESSSAASSEQSRVSESSQAQPASESGASSGA